MKKFNTINMAPMITFNFITLVHGAGIGGAILPIPFLLLE